MSTITFENKKKTQKITITIEEEQEQITVSAKFDPKVWDQDKESAHFVLASHLLKMISDSTENKEMEIEI